MSELESIVEICGNTAVRRRKAAAIGNVARCIAAAELLEWLASELPKFAGTSLDASLKEGLHLADHESDSDVEVYIQKKQAITACIKAVGFTFTTLDAHAFLQTVVESIYQVAESR